jgi:hypothetical protein
MIPIRMEGDSMTATLAKGIGLKGPDLTTEGSTLSKSVWRGELKGLRNSFMGDIGTKAHKTLAGKRFAKGPITIDAPREHAAKVVAEKGRKINKPRGKK